MIRLLTWTGCTNGFYAASMNVNDHESLDRNYNWDYFLVHEQMCLSKWQMSGFQAVPTNFP